MASGFQKDQSRGVVARENFLFALLDQECRHPPGYGERIGLSYIRNEICRSSTIPGKPRQDILLPLPLCRKPREIGKLAENGLPDVACRAQDA